jgi:hypothetical protein
MTSVGVTMSKQREAPSVGNHYIRSLEAPYPLLYAFDHRLAIDTFFQSSFTRRCTDDARQQDRDQGCCCSPRPSGARRASQELGCAPLQGISRPKLQLTLGRDAAAVTFKSCLCLLVRLCRARAQCVAACQYSLAAE